MPVIQAEPPPVFQSSPCQVSFGISLLASACALGAGLAGLSRFRVCQLSWNLAILQFALLVTGWLLGIEGNASHGSVGGLG